MNKLFLVKFFLFLIRPLWYLIHYNFFLGLVQKYLIKNFKYKNLEFIIDYERISLAFSSSFIFNTYEYNDRVLVEKYITEKNKSIIIGGGIGFIASINYKKSSNKFIISEIDQTIINTLNKNLIRNKCIFELIEGNLLVKKNSDYEDFFINKNFLANSKYLNKNSQKKKIKNYQIIDIENYNEYNTLIIDGEGIEEHFVENLNYLPEIEHIFFELHLDILKKSSINLIFENLKKNNFQLVDNCFNSFYYKKNV